MVRDLFGAEIADGICQIPSGTIHNEDRQIWRNTTNGEFTVRSVYHLQEEILAFDQDECSHEGKHNLMWKNLWMMNVTHVVKVFLWKACRNALTTKANLF